ncbi:MAG TPA: ABC transporter ATP-binding protein [Phycisphaerae bacterium]|nr:ABC transporter ATP-binding protein [Phycisphaerae bacterium]
MVDQGLAIQTRQLTKVYPGFFRSQHVQALTQLSLNVQRGRIFGLLGPNGSGKTTTIKLLLGLINPTAGDALVMGQPAGDQETRRRIGYLPEESYLYRFLNAPQTLDFYARLFNMNRPQRRRAVDYYLDFVGLDPAVRRRRIGTYSKGQARRVALATALLNNPDLIIMDEPTSGLDPVGMLEIKKMISRLGEAGKTVLLSTHQLSDVEDVCDRVIILYRGRAQVEGALSDLLEQKDVFQFEARSVTEKLQEQIVELAKNNGAVDIHTGRPRVRLEDLFRQMIESKRQNEEPLVSSGSRL